MVNKCLYIIYFLFMLKYPKDPPIIVRIRGALTLGLVLLCQGLVCLVALHHIWVGPGEESLLFHCPHLALALQGIVLGKRIVLCCGQRDRHQQICYQRLSC